MPVTVRNATLVRINIGVSLVTFAFGMVALGQGGVDVGGFCCVASGATLVLAGMIHLKGSPNDKG